LTATRLKQLLDAFPSVNLAVIGDFFLDKYLVIDPALAEISIETGLEAHQVVGKRLSPGAAGTVTSNLRALGIGIVQAVGAIGDDGEGYELLQGLARTGVDSSHLLQSAEIYTPTYTKPMRILPGGREEEMNRVDIKNRKRLPAALEQAVIAELRAVVPSVEAVIVADQVQEEDFGVVTGAVREELARLAEAYPQVHFFVDSRVRIGRYRNLIVKPNKHEAMAAVRPEFAGEISAEEALNAGRALYERNAKPVYLTLGEDGLAVFTGEGMARVPAVKVEGEIDIVGAGDSCTAGTVSALCAGATFEEAGLVGNLVASITVQQLGTTGTASPAQVYDRYVERFGRE
jgi:rfaE bifunctional protein kinase chain/domain